MSLGPQAAAVDNTRAEPADCEELMARNDKSREDLNTERAKSTISHGQYTNGDHRENLWSRSKGRVAAKYMNDSTNLAAFQGYKEGLPYTQETKEGKTGHKPPRKKMKAEETNITCEGSTFDYRSGKKKSTSNPDPAHTEARIIEDLFKDKPPPMSGSLLMAINWPQKGGEPFKEVPCPECERLVCAAMKCGLEIILCKDGQPEKQDKGKCPPSQAPSS